jgi:hypothetical protein
MYISWLYCLDSGSIQSGTTGKKLTLCTDLPWGTSVLRICRKLVAVFLQEL